MKPTIQRVTTWDLVIRHGKESLGLHHSHTLRFAEEPTLQNFLDVCKLLPWTSMWDDNLLAVLPECKWLKVEPGFKAVHTVIQTEEGNIEITIERSEVWQN